MARRMTKRVAVKKPRKTRSEVYMVNVKYMGEEPKFKPGPISDIDKSRAYGWYGTMCDTDDAREYLDTFLKSLNRLEDAKKVKRIPDSSFPLTCAWLARMASQGVKHSEKTMEFFNARVAEAIALKAAAEEKKEDAPVKEKPNIQERIRDRVAELIGDFEEVLDKHLRGELKEFDAYEYCQKTGLPAQHAVKIASYYAPIYEELEEALEGKDSQLKEAYARCGKNWLKVRIGFLENMLEDLLKYGTNAKKLRVPRKKKPQSVEKKLKNFKYKKEDQEFKLASVPPENIVGAQELWTYNTKYKTLSVFRALDRGGLDVKGASIDKYDEKTSTTRRTGRQAEKIVQGVLGAGKVALRKTMDDLKEAELQSRIGEHTVLLRVIK